MGRNKGVANFSVNFEPTGQAPLDARLLVDTKADLFSSYPDNNFFEKMIVTVADEDAQYMLVDVTKISSEEGWKKLDDTTELENKVTIIENDIVNIKEDISLLQGDTGALGGITSRLEVLETSNTDLEKRVSLLETELNGQNSKLENRIRRNA